MYLVMSTMALASVLMRDVDKEHPIFVLSKTLIDTETRYWKLERHILTLINNVKKPRPYF